MLDNRIVIIGYSGHALVVLDAAIAMGLEIHGYCEPTAVVFNPHALKYFGNESDGAFSWNNDVDFILGIGDNATRYKSAQRINKHNGRVLNVIHPASNIGSSVKIGNGNFVNVNACVNAFATIGDYCILNTGCIVEHECQLGNAVHVAPGAVLAGNVTVGNFSFVGANSVIKQGVRIGENVIIGAGSVVLKDVEDNQIVVGNPAKKIRTQ
ncbi:acetyltransferase [Sphingobacterium pedocola]|uniref:N-acetylneuraminate synthase n=1 Tax=Sphingobacterium pedocola TaxID=2082722 RepID=A0ABR9T9N8_9SPHI|nr:acetyltransferase [Sphingobacterium pedocola]MBE8722045.1 N-acetylneuraminate synthase [Sphingobacterium pedocola]